MFFLWELKSEAQTLNLTIFLSAFPSDPSPCHQNTPFLIVHGRGPHPDATLSILESLFLSSEVWTNVFVSSHPGRTVIYCHFTPQPPSHHQVWALGKPTRLHVPKLVFFTVWQSKVWRNSDFPEPRYSVSPQEYAKPISKSLSFIFSSPYPHMLWIL